MSSPHPIQNQDRTTLNPTEARQAAPAGRLRYVLVIGLVLAVVVLTGCYIAFFA